MIAKNQRYWVQARTEMTYWNETTRGPFDTLKEAKAFVEKCEAFELTLEAKRRHQYAVFQYREPNGLQLVSGEHEWQGASIWT